MKQNLIRTVELIGKALHPDHLKANDFIFSKRADLLGHMQVNEIVDFELRIFVKVACDTENSNVNPHTFAKGIIPIQ